MSPVAQSTADLMAQVGREYILLAAKDGAGKSCAVVSLAKWVQMVLNPDARFYVLDTENKFPTALKSFGDQAPTNIVYFKCDNMNDCTNAAATIFKERRPQDWLALESMARLWEKAQDLAYKTCSGYEKAEYLEIRHQMKLAGKGEPAPIPKPDQFWSIAKGAHDGEILDEITSASTLNVIMTTTLSRPPKADAFIKENADRKALRVEFGLDAGMDGAPRLPTYPETTLLLDIQGGKVISRILRDNLSRLPNPKQQFEVTDRFSWAQQFWLTCRV